MAKLREVFKPGGLPNYTYQKRDEYKLEGSLKDALNRLNKFIVISGPTKSGKTVLARKVLESDSTIWVEGGQISTEQELWVSILMDLGIPVELQKGNANAIESSNTLELETSFKPSGVGAGIKNTEQTKSNKLINESSKSAVLPVKAAIDALKTSEKTLVVDDFHYLPQECQTSLIRALKAPVFSGLQVLLILIPHRLHDAARAEIDIDGRTHAIRIPEWQPTELFSIAESGFRALNVYCSAIIIDRLIKESFHSPHLIQDFCSKLCSDQEVNETCILGKEKNLTFIKNPDSFFADFAEAMSTDILQALRRGPDRTNRIDRPLKSGGNCDIYEAVLFAIRRTGPSPLIRWDELKTNLQQILADDVPQQFEVTRVLERMDEIAKEQSGDPVIDYIKGELHITDPFFMFLLKWSGAIDAPPPSGQGLLPL